MTATLQGNLFAPSNASVIESSAQWLERLVTGPLVLLLSTLAIIGIAYLLLSGRLAIRQGAAVVVGTLIVLGAPTIASGLIEAMRPGSPTAVIDRDAPVEFGPREELPPASSDPYSGA